jgi:hypothetical protein
MDRLLVAALAAEDFVRPAGDDLVRVHVSRGAGAGLEDIDGKLGVELASDDFVGSLDDGLGQLF